MKKFIAIATLSLATLTVAGAKSYGINLVNPTKVGSIQLRPGVYSVKVNGSNAIFTDEKTSQSYQVPVKVETTEKKFDDTRVQSSKDGDVDKIDEIDLGGSKTKLGF
jgi:hypothetical protein